MLSKKKVFFWRFLGVFLPYNIQMRCICRKMHFLLKDFFSQDKSIQSTDLKIFFDMKHNFDSFRTIRSQNSPFLPKRLKSECTFFKKKGKKYQNFLSMS